MLGYVYNPLSLYWCHDADGTLRHVIAEVHNTHGERHAYLLPPSGEQPVMVRKRIYASAFNGVDGYYLVRAPRPADAVDVSISLHRDQHPAFVATLRGTRRSAGPGQVLRMQLTAPAAPLMGRWSMKVQGALLWLRRVPVVPRHAEGCPVPRIARTPLPIRSGMKPILLHRLSYRESRSQLL